MPRLDKPPENKNIEISIAQAIAGVIPER